MACEKLPLVAERFLRYVSFETTSDFDCADAPSSAGQTVLGESLLAELKELGLEDAHIAKGGVVMGSIPATAGCETLPAVGFIAHMDTSPEAPGANIKARVHHYTGGDIVLNEAQAITMTVEKFPEIAKYAGEDIIVTDGTTLLGADDKAGIAAIMGMVQYFKSHPEVAHAKICVAFTPDEEISRGTANFDIEAFGADYAYTIDGDERGELNCETFNAATATVVFHGIPVHPGQAKDKMLNAVRLAADFVARLPYEEGPESTEDHEGYIHANKFGGTVREATVNVLIRDHDTEKFEEKKARVKAMEAIYNERYGAGTCEITVKDYYANMAVFLAKAPKVVEIAKEAYRACELPVHVRPIRGGTDGARLSAKGLPCPNLFTGGMNFHGVFECIPVKSLVKAEEVAIAIGTISATVKSLTE